MTVIYPDTDSTQFEFHIISDVVDGMVVGSSNDREDDFDAVLAATVLDRNYEEFFKDTSKAFADASPSELSRIALEALSETSEELGLGPVNTAELAMGNISKGNDIGIT